MREEPVHSDARRHAKPREQVKLENQSNVYNAMRTLGRPATIAEVSKHVGGIVERTVRRAILDLVNSGYVIEAGKAENSALYAVRGQMPMGAAAKAVVPFGSGKLMPVGDFIDVMASPDGNPMHKGGKDGTKKPVMSDAMASAIRQRMTFVILTSGEPGFANAVHTYHNGLIAIQQELEYLLGIVKAFNDSAVWYDHYRDQLAVGVREMQKNNPELFQLAMDYIANLANRE